MWKPTSRADQVITMLEWLATHLALIMFVSMFVFIFLGYPVAFILGGMSLFFALVGAALGAFNLIGISRHRAAHVGARARPRRCSSRPRSWR